MKDFSTTPITTNHLTGNQSVQHRIDRADRQHVQSDGKKVRPVGTPTRLLRVGVVPLVFELYDCIAPDFRARAQQFFDKVSRELHIDNVELLPCELVSNLSHMKRVCESLASQNVDTIVVAHLSYVPSGQILEALTTIDTPVLLWPAQPMERIDAETLDGVDVMLNHSVHGTMDLANMLRRANRPYGVVHGHWSEPKFQLDLRLSAQVGAMLQTLRHANPLVLGQRFPDMLDLQLEDEPFIKRLGITPKHVPLAEFAELRHEVSQSDALEVCKSYQQKFRVDSSLEEALLLGSAKNEIVLRRLLEKYQSRALAVNFLDVCAEPEIADALHLPVSNLMSEGVGYGAEADWETASMIAAMQTVLGIDQVGFTEVFSVDYGTNRILLRHWGEGNPTQAAEKPSVIRSVLNHISTYTAFPICDFQFRPGRYSLMNMSATPEGQGQIIVVPGVIEETRLPNCDGVRSLFKSDFKDVRELLNRYAILGGSHHLLLVQENSGQLVEKFAQQTGWAQYTIE